MSNQNYTVTWSIDLDSDTGPYGAAKKALEIMQDEGSSATCFEVSAGDGFKTFVDLDNELCKTSLVGNPIQKNAMFITPDSYDYLIDCIKSYPEDRRADLLVVASMAVNLCHEVVDKAIKEGTLK